MGFRLTTQEALGAGISRVTGEELAAAIVSLRDPASGIHAGRKSIKKLRAMMRLVEPRLARLARHENSALGEAGRSISGARDGQAVVEIVDVLLGQVTSKTAARSLAALRKRLLVIRQPEVCVTAPALQLLAEVAARVSEWPPLPDSFASIGEGLRETYRQGRKALAAVAAQPCNDTFHTLRKRVKDHWYQVRLLQGAWTAAEPREKELRELQECLGLEHDLTVLEETAPLTPTVQAVVASARREYRSQAVALAAVLYGEKSKVHTARVQELWQDWRRTRDVARKGPASAHVRRRRQVA